MRLRHYAIAISFSMSFAMSWMTGVILESQAARARISSISLLPLVTCCTFECRGDFHGAAYQFPPDIIRHAVWLYLRFTLSFRDVEDLLAERGLDLSYETVRRWVLKFGPLFAKELRRRRHRPTSQWHLDEMAVLISGKQVWLWRAVDDEGEILDLLVQRRRDARAAARLMRKLPQEARLCARSAGDRQASVLWSGQDATAIVRSP